MEQERGRGRLSSIELLPEDFDDIVTWASAELKERKQLQIDIHAEFNRRIAARAAEIGIEIKPISLSSFNRFSVGMARATRRVEDTRAITAVLTERLEPGQTDDLTIAAGEVIKTLVFEILQNAGEAGLDPKGALQLAGALHKAAQAQSISADRRRKLEEELEAKTDKALSAVVKAKGLTAETAEQIKRQILGIGA